MNKKIMLVITGLNIGGAEKQVSLLADKFVERNNTVQIVNLTGKVEVTTNSNINIINIGMKKSFIGFISTIVSLVKITKAFAPDVVHSHMFHANIMARISRGFSKRKYKLICTAHSKNEGGKIRMLAYRITDFFCDITTNVSGEALDEFIKKKAFSKFKSIAVYNGIDTNEFKFSDGDRVRLRNELCISSSEKLILAVGRLTDAKDYPNLLYAFKLLSVNYKIVIIGDGELRPDIEKLIGELGLDSRVFLMGSLMDVSPYYSACDIFVTSSKWEGFGLVAAEAMSSECLVVGTNSGGVAEVIGDKSFIVPISDSQALADKIEEVMCLSQESILEIKHRNRKHIENNFSIDSITDRWMKIFFDKKKSTEG
ncbi:glycosyltransferase [Cedecea neteri]|uniref:glycosyltransferase n=1 Tax=Cedecea neteri TaxID=158822 RepID=UPI002AA87E40|nr:glycosyltransferase [Cedecea neteri]WPU24679.1 glycosyltransferase [Cedecea neteri]